MKLRPESEFSNVLADTRKEAKKVNEDIETLGCWPRDSQVLRYDQVKQNYEKVPMAEVQLGDEVMVINPKKREVGREKIIYLHDHNKESQPSD